RRSGAGLGHDPGPRVGGSAPHACRTTAFRSGSGRRGPVIGPCGRIDLLRGIGTISTMAVVSDPTNPPSKPVTLYSAADAPAAALTGETVAVLGYGYLGRTAALN